MLLLYAALNCCIQSVLSGITTTPGMQRKYQGETVTFQWSVTVPISSFSVYNQISGQLNYNANYTLDSLNGVVTLIIRNVQLSDAGNYSLSVTTGTTTQTDTGALLFVFGAAFSIFVNHTSDRSGQQPATEGDAVELTCTLISTSLPVAYRPKIYYQWYLPWVNSYLQNISSGQATLQTYGDPVPGYSIKNEGRALVIASVQYRDAGGIRCYGQEQWSPYRSSSVWPSQSLKYRPYITWESPASRKSNAIVGDYVSLTFNFQAYPVVTSATNWSFINTAGQAQDLPVGWSYISSWSQQTIVFTLTTIAYYGNYSITVNNSIGATTETFQVLGLGPPDAPSGVTVDFVSHRLIAIVWTCMWFNGRQQTIFLQLRALNNDSIIDSQNTTVYTDFYHSTSITQFQNGIQPESDYEVRIWSTNNLGSSDVIELSVRTPKVFKFFVSPKTISFNGNQAIVSYSATEGKIGRLYVPYCLESTGYCDLTKYYYNVNSTAGQITYDNLQSGDVYIFDFEVYGGDPRRRIYYLTMVKGVRVSRNGATDDSSDEKPNPLLVAVIVLAVLLGVAVLALIGCLLAFLISKRRQKTQPNNLPQIQPRAVVSTYAPQPATQQKSKAYEEDDTYEAVDETNYTALEGQRRR